MLKPRCSLKFEIFKNIYVKCNINDFRGYLLKQQYEILSMKCDAFDYKTSFSPERKFRVTISGGKKVCAHAHAHRMVLGHDRNVLIKP